MTLIIRGRWALQRWESPSKTQVRPLLISSSTVCAGNSRWLCMNVSLLTVRNSMSYLSSFGWRIRPLNPKQTAFQHQNVWYPSGSPGESERLYKLGVIKKVVNYNTSNKVYLSKIKITDFKNYLKKVQVHKKLLNYSNASKCNLLLSTSALTDPNWPKQSAHDQ